jgi:hypothetical protein
MPAFQPLKALIDNLKIQVFHAALITLRAIGILRGASHDPALKLPPA